MHLKSWPLRLLIEAKMEFPKAVQSYIERRIVKMAGAAYLEFNSEGDLLSWGGSLDYHGVVHPSRGKHLSDVAPFLDDVAPPFVNQRLVLSQTQTRDHHYSDVHFFQAKGSEWVLFLDRTHENRGFQVIQQCFNELTLLRELYSRELEKHENSNGAAALQDTIDTLTRETERLLNEKRVWIENATFSHILDDLQVVVTQRMATSLFRIEKCPQWFEKLVAGAVDGAIVDMVTTFPYLESFFEEASVVWDGYLPGPIRSGLWIENDCDGNEVALQATALCHGDDPLLLLMFPSFDYHKEQRILTRARSTELEHEKLRKEIEKKEILLHCIVHDLAGPTHGIQGTLELLAGSGLGEDQRQMVELCGKQCQVQQRLIRNILGAFSAEIASPQSMEITAEEAPDALDALNDVRDILGSAFTTRGVELKVSNQVPEGVDRRLAIEKDSLGRAIINLAENALWHSMRGTKVTLGLSLQGSDILITVDDQGPGVAPEIRDHLFQKFSQGSRSSKGKVGLGLYFCRITAVEWGGTVGQENLPGGGARFWIRLPRFIPKAGTTPEMP
jgi:signal transduction histidine kinase